MRRCDRALRATVTRMREDFATVRAKDPAAGSNGEVLLYPHILALWTYRVAHRLWRHGHRVTARALSLGARAVTGIEIHPAAVIGRRFFIDHGTAVVIGATVRIGDDVMLYHQVTLGSVGWWKDLRRPASARRHPVIEDGVVIGTGASVLGPVTVGAGTRIGAHAVVLTDLAPGTRVTAPTAEIRPPVAGPPPPTGRPPAAGAAPEAAATPAPVRIRPVRSRSMRGRAALPSASGPVRRAGPPEAGP